MRPVEDEDLEKDKDTDGDERDGANLCENPLQVMSLPWSTREAA